MLPAPASGFVLPQLGSQNIIWPLGQNQGQWNSLLASMGGSPLNTQPTSYIPGAPNIQQSQTQRGQDPSLPQQPSGPSDTTRNLLAALQAASVVRQGTNLVNQFTQSPAVATGSAGAGAGLGAAGAGLQFSQGQYGPGTLSLLNALSQGTRATTGLGLAPKVAGQVGGALGGAAGIAGGAYGLSQGDPHAGTGIVSGTGQAASSLGSLLGYQAPAFGAAGAGATEAGAGTAALASGEGVGLGTALGTLGEALGPLGLVLGLGALGDVGISALQDKWQALIPQGVSEARNPTSYRSALTGSMGSDALRQALPNASIRDLFGLASRGLTQNGEIQFRNDALGDYNSPGYQALLQKAMSGDLQALHDFVKGIQVYSGEAGAAKPNDTVTDAYQRNLVSRLPQELQNQLLADPDLFKVKTDYYSPEQLAGMQTQLAQREAMGSQLAGSDTTGVMTGLQSSLDLSPLFRTTQNRQGVQDLLTAALQGTIPYQYLYQDPYYAQFEQYTHPASQE